MKRAWVLLAILVLTCTAVLARSQRNQAMPRLVTQARFIYVTSYDGPPWSNEVLSEDRQAVADVQDALREWGKYTVVYEPAKADLILVVQRRGSEDVLAVYENHPLSSIPLWRGMADDGLASGELPLFADFRRAVEQASRK